MERPVELGNAQYGHRPTVKYTYDIYIRYPSRATSNTRN